MNPLIDIGANLTHDSFDEDRDEVIQRAITAGVARFIVTGSSEQGSKDAYALASQQPGILYATAGVHPHHANEYSMRVEDTLSQLLNDESVVAVGECGLDYFRNFSPVDAQRHAFSAQIKLAETIISDSNNKIDTMEKQITQIRASNREVPLDLYVWFFHLESLFV